MDLGLELYPAQEEAVLEVLAGHHVILATPTGSGKSMVAVAAHLRALALGARSYYTSPIKALASEKFFALCRTFGPDNVGMLTGDASINPDAPIICCTAEILSNLVLREGEDAAVDQVVMDEFHYYADRDRGMAWQIPLLELPQTTFLLMSATLGETSAIEKQLQERSGKTVRVVRSTDRPVPLDFSYGESTLQNTLEQLLSKERAPVYVVNFSQRDAAERAQSLTSINLCDREQKRAIADAIGAFRFDSPYGKEISRYLRHGLGLHHAGLLPKYRLLVERLAQQGLLKVISGTDTLGVGVNIPIRCVVFSKLCKYDGEKTRILSVRDFLQIAGRAGRKGFDEQGWVMAQAPEHVIENRRLAAKAAMSGRKKFTRKKPPERGYVPWNEDTFTRLHTGQAEALKSVFKVDHGLLLNALQRPADQRYPGGGYGALISLIGRSHEHAGSKKHLRRDAAKLFKALRSAGVVELVPREQGRGQRAIAAEGLQENFSLHHSLSLYLVTALDHLDQRAEDYPLSLLSRVEAILEQPRPVLARQVSKVKGELVAQMKAEGIEYEERMARLEEVTWPKPEAERIYQSFNHFERSHPWVAQDNIKPKSVARDMYERYLSFNDYVLEYGLQRMEGVLLRYLSQVYKTCLQNVPERYKSDEVIDLEAWLRATLTRADSSLVTEWEQMRQQGPALPEAIQEKDTQRPPPDLSADPRAFNARVRAELHRLVKALSEQDWEEAALSVRQSEQDPWPAARFETSLESFFASYERLRFDHQARLADKTQMHPAGHRRWELSQVLCDPEDDNYWCLETVVDLSEPLSPEDAALPIITLQRIGT